MFNRAKFVDQSNQKTNQNNAIAKPMNMEKKAAINIIVGLGVERKRIIMTDGSSF